MFLGIIPTLSKKGFFARYYGGCELYDSLDDRPGPISLPDLPGGEPDLSSIPGPGPELDNKCYIFIASLNASS